MALRLMRGKGFCAAFPWRGNARRYAWLKSQRLQGKTIVVDSARLGSSATEQHACFSGLFTKQKMQQ